MLGFYSLFLGRFKYEICHYYISNEKAVCALNREPKIIDEKIFRLLGCVFYGDPFHSAKEWTIENEIGKTWLRFGNLSRKYSILLKKINANPYVAYEIHIEPEEYKKTKKYDIFVGIEVKNYEEVPVEMFVKILPKTRYVMFITKGRDFSEGEYVFKKWLPNSNCEQAYPYIIQSYDRRRFKALDDEESEIDWYIPIKEK